MTLAVGVLVSGSGTNLQAILDAQAAGALGGAQVRVVVSNRADAYALTRARAAGVETVVVDHRGYAGREAFEDALLGELRGRGVELCALAGFMRLLTPHFLRGFPDRVVNIHPALLPAFPGVHAQRQALEYGVKITGCSVHFVDEGTDTGPVIAQAAVPVLDGDDEERLTARILAEEHRLYPLVLRLFGEGRIERQGRQVRVRDAAPPAVAALRVPPG
jgi:phosphoribosylglycinamide formyltransferase-1